MTIQTPAVDNRQLDQLFAELRGTEPNLFDQALTDDLMLAVSIRQRRAKRTSHSIQIGFAVLAMILVVALFPWAVLALPNAIVINPTSLLYGFISLATICYYSWYWVEQR